MWTSGFWNSLVHFMNASKFFKKGLQIQHFVLLLILSVYLFVCSGCATASGRTARPTGGSGWTTSPSRDFTFS